MPCSVVKVGDSYAIVTHARQPRRRCRFCAHGLVERLCDFPLGPGKTCDEGMCSQCATRMGADLDYCPRHKHSKPAAQQRSLWEGISR
jgi:hypothetical protein